MEVAGSDKLKSKLQVILFCIESNVRVKLKQYLLKYFVFVDSNRMYENKIHFMLFLTRKPFKGSWEAILIMLKQIKAFRIVRNHLDMFDLGK